MNKVTLAASAPALALLLAMSQWTAEPACARRGGDDIRIRIAQYNDEQPSPGGAEEGDPEQGGAAEQDVNPSLPPSIAPYRQPNPFETGPMINPGAPMVNPDVGQDTGDDPGGQEPGAEQQSED